jgi:hypothetical protein
VWENKMAVLLFKTKREEKSNEEKKRREKRIDAL